LRLENERRGLQLRIEAAEGARAEAAAQFETAVTALSGAEAGLQEIIEACATGEARRAALERQQRELTNRHSQLQARLADNDRPPVLSLLEVPEGFEAATAALFDGELSAPLLPSDREARDVTSGWVALAPLAETAALPAGVHAFAPEIGAPAALARRLGQAGWV